MKGGGRCTDHSYSGESSLSSFASQGLPTPLKEQSTGGVGATDGIMSTSHLQQHQQQYHKDSSISLRWHDSSAQLIEEGVY